MANSISGLERNLVRSRRGDKGRDDRKFLEVLHYFVVRNIALRAP